LKFQKPTIKEIESLSLSSINQYELDSGLPVHELNFPNSAEVIKITIIFNAGRLFEYKKLASKVTAAIVKEGTTNYSSKEIANQFDFYGAYMDTSSGMDYSKISFLCLNKHFDKISQVCTEIIFEPSFNEVEFKKHKQRAIENLKNQLSKNDVLGYRVLTEEIFGGDHPYGYNSTRDTYEDLNIETLKEHYKNTYNTNNCNLFISGNITPEIRKQLNKSFGSIKRTIPTLSKFDLSPNHITNNKIRVKGKQNIQKAIYIGGRLFKRNHPDYFGMLVLNTILGGYFSSRLNKRIREDEALTYGIDSQLDIMLEDGFFYISAEVENNNEKPVLKAIYEELELIKTVLVNDDELNNVRRYLKGQILSFLH